jgi:hypothetical protein
VTDASTAAQGVIGDRQPTPVNIWDGEIPQPVVPGEPVR